MKITVKNAVCEESSATHALMLGPCSNGRWSVAQDDVGVGRSIPLKQGQVRKHSKGAAAAHTRWVTLTNEGVFTYYPTLQDYMTGKAPGKSINLLVRFGFNGAGKEPVGAAGCSLLDSE